MPVARVLGCAPHMVLTWLQNQWVERPKSVREWETLTKGTMIAQGRREGETGQLCVVFVAAQYVHIYTC